MFFINVPIYIIVNATEIAAFSQAKLIYAKLCLTECAISDVVDYIVNDNEIVACSLRKAHICKALLD